MNNQVDSDAMIQLFRGIQAEFPHLTMTLGLQHEFVDLYMTIVEQERLRFEVSLFFYDDILQLHAGDRFTLEWFPCTKPSIVEEYAEAVRGLLSGKYRILEYYRTGRYVKAHLQRPDGMKWKTIGSSYSGLFDLIPWGLTERELRVS